MHTELTQNHSLGPPMKFDKSSLTNLENLSKKIKGELWIPFVGRWENALANLEPFSEFPEGVPACRPGPTLCKLHSVT